jgi:hypothetical protein
MKKKPHWRVPAEVVVAVEADSELEAIRKAEELLGKKLPKWSTFAADSAHLSE